MPNSWQLAAGSWQKIVITRFSCLLPAARYCQPPAARY